MGLPELKPGDMVPLPYWRWSDPEQGKGSTKDRQDDVITAMCRAQGWPTTFPEIFNDKGRSAYYAWHLSEGDLGRFVQEAKDGKWGHGNILCIEDQDRFSRMELRPTQQLLWDILDCGVWVAFAHPFTVIKPGDENNLHKMIPFLFQADRANTESSRKSTLVGPGWKKRKERLRQKGYDGKGPIPGWLKKKGKALEFIPEHKATLEMIFQWVADGLGVQAVIQKLVDVGRKPWGRSGKWHVSSVQRDLAGPACYGGYQPYTRIRGGKKSAKEKDGPEIRDYYPAAVSVEAWLAARRAMKGRRKQGGRKGEIESNLFTHLLRCARTGQKLQLQPGRHKGNNGAYLGTPRAEYTQERCGSVRFRYAQFEPAIIDFLSRLRVSQVIPPDSDMAAAMAQLDACDQKIRNLNNTTEENARYLADPTINATMRSAIMGALRAVSEELERTVSEREILARKVECQHASALRNIQSLSQVLDRVKGTEQEKETRLKIKRQIKSLVEEIWVYPVQINRLCVFLHCQIYLIGGARFPLQIPPINPPEGLIPDDYSDDDFRSRHG